MNEERIQSSTVQRDEEGMYLEVKPIEAQAAHLTDTHADNATYFRPMTPGAQMPKPRMKRLRNGTMPTEDEYDNTGSDASLLAFQLSVGDNIC